ncbi:hypothetical protein GGS24DRAFT_99554 [Hypoxylon argillaceum]|nr:hypothetical protein GGS24DRAFT_99554 [Hypoxylon argillaceum]
MAPQAPTSGNYDKVRILNIKWKSHDLGANIDEQYKNIEALAVKLSFELIPFVIEPSQRNGYDLKSALRKFFEPTHTTLHIVYYHGHGYVPKTQDVALTLFSHNEADEQDIQRSGERFESCGKLLYRLSQQLKGLTDRPYNGALDLLDQISQETEKLREEEGRLRSKLKPDFEIHFKNTILPTIIEAKCDILVLLDCCDAGAVVQDVSPEQIVDGNYNKHVICACPKGSTANGNMTSTLYKVLSGKRHELDVATDKVTEYEAEEKRRASSANAARKAYDAAQAAEKTSERQNIKSAKNKLAQRTKKLETAKQATQAAKKEL